MPVEKFEPKNERELIKIEQPKLKSVVVNRQCSIPSREDNPV